MRRSENRAYFNQALAKLCELKEGWISGGRAISKIAIQTTRVVLNALPDCDELQYLYIAPFVNGSVFLNYHNGDKCMCLNIAGLGVSAISYESDKLKSYKSDKFKPHEIDKIVDFIKKGMICEDQIGLKELEMVDLGLSVRWAKYNIGAEPGSTKESYYGDFYAWGETKPKSVYSWETYVHSTPDYEPYEMKGSLTKYTDSDGKTVLEAVDNVAIKMCGTDYRMPTKAELEELLSLSNKWVTNYNDIPGLNGRVFTGINGNTLFIPAAGLLYKTSHNQDGSACYLWCTSLSSYKSYYALDLCFTSYDIDVTDDDRYYGFSVRCVSKK